MELRHFRYFVAVAEEMSFGRAAERLRMSQPPLSRQVGDLEREIGATLLDRSRRRIRLTHAGRVFLEEAKLTLAQAERSARTARRAQRGEIGVLSMGFIGSATYRVLPELLRAFRKRCPDVELRLQTMSTGQQIEAFRSERIQVGLLRPPTDGTLHTKTILREPLVAALPTDHPLAERKRVPLSGLADEDFILWPRESVPDVHDRIVGLCRQAGFEPNVVQSSSELQTIIGLVAAGIGVSLMVARPEHLLQHPKVVYRAVCKPQVLWEMAVAWKKDEDSPIVRAFLEGMDPAIGSA